jgi:hypothetical protein
LVFVNFTLEPERRAPVTEPAVISTGQASTHAYETLNGVVPLSGTSTGHSYQAHPIQGRSRTVSNLTLNIEAARHLGTMEPPPAPGPQPLNRSHDHYLLPITNRITNLSLSGTATSTPQSSLVDFDSDDEVAEPLPPYALQAPQHIPLPPRRERPSARRGTMSASDFEGFQYGFEHGGSSPPRERGRFVGLDRSVWGRPPPTPVLETDENESQADDSTSHRVNYFEDIIPTGGMLLCF